VIGLYIEKNLLDKLPKKGGQIKVLMGDYGYWPIAVK